MQARILIFCLQSFNVSLMVSLCDHAEPKNIDKKFNTLDISSLSLYYKYYTLLELFRTTAHFLYRLAYKIMAYLKRRRMGP